MREKNAAYLGELLRETPGVKPAGSYSGCTRNAYHLYMMRYNQEAFGGLPRARFVQAVRAEGAPISAGYRWRERGRGPLDPPKRLAWRQDGYSNTPRRSKRRSPPPLHPGRL